LFFLYLKFPEEIPNEQSATPKRETLLSPDLRDRLLKVMKNNPPGAEKKLQLFCYLFNPSTICRTYPRGMAFGFHRASGAGGVNLFGLSR